jgi:hypothetical protein
LTTALQIGPSTRLLPLEQGRVHYQDENRKTEVNTSFLSIRKERAAIHPLVDSIAGGMPLTGFVEKLATSENHDVDC